MKDLMKLMQMEVFNCIEEKPDDDVSGSSGNEVKIGSETVKISEDVDLRDPALSTDSESKEEEEQTGSISAEQLEGLPEGFAEQLKGKSVQDILKDYANSQSHIGKLNTKIGVLQEQASGKDVQTSEQLTTDNNTLMNEIKEKESKLADMNEMVDGDDFVKLNRDIEKLKGKSDKFKSDIEDLKVNELVAERYDKDFNDGALKNMRESLKKDFGLDFEDNVWGALSTKAKEINGAGKISAESMESAVIMTVGAEVYRKTLTTQGEQDLRGKLKKAGEAALPLLTGEGGKGKQPLDYNNLPPAVKSAVVNSLSNKQFQKVFKEKYGYDLTSIE